VGPFISVVAAPFMFVFLLAIQAIIFIKLQWLTKISKNVDPVPTSIICSRPAGYAHTAILI